MRCIAMTWLRVADSCERTPRTMMTSPNSATRRLMNSFAGSIFNRSVHQRNLREGAG